jgi:hypothetical protein
MRVGRLDGVGSSRVGFERGPAHAPVVLFPMTDMAAFWYAQDHGIFKKNVLNVKATVVTDATALTADLVSGNADIMHHALPSMVAAVDRRHPDEDDCGRRLHAEDRIHRGPRPQGLGHQPLRPANREDAGQRGAARHRRSRNAGCNRCLRW